MTLQEEKEKIQDNYIAALANGLPSKELSEYRKILDDIDQKINKLGMPPEVPGQKIVIRFFGIPVYSRISSIDENSFYERMKFLFNQEVEKEIKKQSKK